MEHIIVYKRRQQGKEKTRDTAVHVKKIVIYVNIN